jgi:hypothetical protein
MVNHAREVYAAATPTSLDAQDCTVRALCVAANLPRETADALLTKHGRARMKGCRSNVFGPAYEEAGAVRVSDLRRQTLAAFVRNNPRGRFVVLVRGHALAVVDGVIHDWRSGARRIAWAAYRFA